MPGLIIGGVIVLFLAVILLRAALFNPKPQKAISNQAVSFDKDGAVDALAQLVRCKTISYNDPALEDNAEFEKLTTMLHDLYPRVFDVCSLRELPGRALLLRWPGKSEAAPTVLMSHYDVVPVDEEK